MLVFSLLVVLVFYFALPGSAEDLQRSAAGLLWVAYLFAAVLGLNRAFTLELENDAIAGLALAPANRGWIFAGKAAASFVLISAVELVTAFVFAVLLDLDLWPVALPLAGVVALGTLGIASVGTLFAAMAVRTRLREVLLPILLIPALFPVLSGAVAGSTAVLAGEPPPASSLQLLVVVDGVYSIVSFLGFDYILDE
jgi:heme exporter protein B